MRIVLVSALYLALCYANPHYQKHPGISPRVNGGQPAYDGQFPFLAAVYTDTPAGRFFCAGTLINVEWILTSGFCAVNATRFTIELGRANLRISTENAATFVTSHYVLHPQFNVQTYQNNLALIKLERPVHITAFVQPIEKLGEMEQHASTIAVAIGWGQTVTSETVPISNLHYVHVATLHEATCRQTYGSIVTNQIVCAGGNINQGTCQGDLGGPLIYTGDGDAANMFSTVIGVATFNSGAESCRGLHPSGYTKVYPFRQWIVNTTRLI